MSPEISERAFEAAIECALLRHGPDACAGEPAAVGEASVPYGESLPGGLPQARACRAGVPSGAWIRPNRGGLERGTLRPISTRED